MSKILPESRAPVKRPLIGPGSPILASSQVSVGFERRPGLTVAEPPSNEGMDARDLKGRFR